MAAVKTLGILKYPNMKIESYDGEKRITVISVEEGGKRVKIMLPLRQIRDLAKIAGDAFEKEDQYLRSRVDDSARLRRESGLKEKS